MGQLSDPSGLPPAARWVVKQETLTTRFARLADQAQGWRGDCGPLRAPKIGTETNGSIICPSHVQGLVGFKPTVGPCRRHIVPISASQDTAGPMALDVDSANQLFLAISDQSTQGEPRSRSKPTQPAELRLGIAEAQPDITSG